MIAAATKIMLDFTCSPNLPRICRRLSNKSLFGLPLAVSCVSVRNIVEFRALKHSLTISTRSCGIFCSHDKSAFNVFVCRWLSEINTEKVSVRFFFPDLQLSISTQDSVRSRLRRCRQWVPYLITEERKQLTTTLDHLLESNKAQAQIALQRHPVKVEPLLIKSDDLGKQRSLDSSLVFN